MRSRGHQVGHVAAQLRSSEEASEPAPPANKGRQQPPSRPAQMDHQRQRTTADGEPDPHCQGGGRGFKSRQDRHVMSPDLPDGRTYEVVGPAFCFLGLRAGRASGALVVLAGIEGERAQEFAGGGVDDADLEVFDQEQDVGSGVGSSDSDVVELAVVAQRDGAGFVDAVLADSLSWVVLAPPGGFGARGMDGGRGGAVRQVITAELISPERPSRPGRAAPRCR